MLSCGCDVIVKCCLVIIMWLSFGCDVIVMCCHVIAMCYYVVVMWLSWESFLMHPTPLDKKVKYTVTPPLSTVQKISRQNPANSVQGTEVSEVQLINYYNSQNTRICMSQVQRPLEVCDPASILPGCTAGVSGDRPVGPQISRGRTPGR